MPVPINVHLVIRSNNKSAVKMLLSFTVCKSNCEDRSSASFNNIAFSVVFDLQIPQLNQVKVQNLLFYDRIIILL